jgi:predicted dehydrogenase
VRIAREIRRTGIRLVKPRTMQIGVVGPGRGFTLMLPTFLHDSRVRLVGAADPIAAAKAQLESDFGAPGHASVEALCADPAVELLYIASPHQFHAEHVCLAASFGKHVLVEKPMALSAEECTRMIGACWRAGVHLIVGHSHSFNLPIRRTGEIIDSGMFGDTRMITAMNFTDFFVPPAAARRTRHGSRRRRHPQPGDAPDGHRAPAERQAGPQRACSYRFLGSGAPDGRRLQRAAGL